MLADNQDSENEVVFLIPEETAKKSRVSEGQGESPVLRRSNWKNKSVSAVPDMSKG